MSWDDPARVHVVAGSSCGGKRLPLVTLGMMRKWDFASGGNPMLTSLNRAKAAAVDATQLVRSCGLSILGLCLACLASLRCGGVDVSEAPAGATAGTGGTDASGSSSGSGGADCGADVSTDPDNCGACGHA